MKKIMIAIGVLTVAFGVIWASRAWSTLRANARNAKFNEDVENLFVGLQKYKERVGSYPIGSNSQVAKALQGNNDKNVIILNAHVPDVVWSSPEWREAIQCDGHTFPVHVWKREAGSCSRVKTVRLPCDRGGFQIVPVDDLGGGLGGIEDSPAIMTREGALPLA